MSISSGSIHFLRIELKFEYVDVDSSLPPPLHEWYRTLKIIVYTTYIYTQIEIEIHVNQVPIK